MTTWIYMVDSGKSLLITVEDGLDLQLNKSKQKTWFTKTWLSTTVYTVDKLVDNME